MSYRLCLWSLVVLCFSPRLAHCTGPLILQSQWGSKGLSSGLVPQSAYNGDDLISFDDMPACIKKTCLPFDPTVIGCPEKSTKNCYCASNFTWQCTYGEATCPQTLFWQWLAHVCLAAPLDSFSTIPPCAQECVEQAVVFSSCGLFSWDCFCNNGVAKSCLTMCTTKDKAKMEAWRTEQCLVYDDGPSLALAASSSSPSSSTITSARSTTSNAARSTDTVSTTSGGDQNHNTNNIIASRSARQRPPPGVTM